MRKLNYHKLEKTKDAIESYYKIKYPDVKYDIDVSSFSDYFIPGYYIYSNLWGQKEELIFVYHLRITRHIWPYPMRFWMHRAQSDMQMAPMKIGDKGLITKHDDVLRNYIHPDRNEILFIDNRFGAHIILRISGFMYEGKKIEEALPHRSLEDDKFMTQYILSNYKNELDAFYMEIQNMALDIDKILKEQ